MISSLDLLSTLPSALTARACSLAPDAAAGRPAQTLAARLASLQLLQQLAAAQCKAVEAALLQIQQQLWILDTPAQPQVHPMFHPFSRLVPCVMPLSRNSSGSSKAGFYICGACPRLG